jgi:hypothetical protein
LSWLVAKQSTDVAAGRADRPEVRPSPAPRLKAETRDMSKGSTRNLDAVKRCSSAWHDALDATFGIAPDLSSGADYAAELREADTARGNDLMRRWQR